MFFAGFIAILLIGGLIVGDWFQFTTLKTWACEYGCRLAQRKDGLRSHSLSSFAGQFSPGATLRLPHGIARWVAERQIVVIRPTYKLFSLRFRTAWPLKGAIHVRPENEGLLFHLSKRIPWSSAVLTGIWLLFVVGGTLTFTVMYALDGGFSTLGGFFWGLGLIALGMLVLAGGVILFAFAYKLEDSRLMQVYAELFEVLEPSTEQDK